MSLWSDEALLDMLDLGDEDIDAQMDAMSEDQRKQTIEDKEDLQRWLEEAHMEDPTKDWDAGGWLVDRIMRDRGGANVQQG